MTDKDKGNGAVAVRQKRPTRLLTWPEEVERYFDAQWKRWPLRLWRRPGTWLPEMDVFEKEGKLIVRTDIPGMTPENIEVTVEGDVLTIKGHREEEKEVKEEDYYCSERATGEFFRSIRLPDGVTGEGVEARYDNGVLEVTVPKPAAAKAQSVKVPVK
jgi:HSP20 family protein